MSVTRRQFLLSTAGAAVGAIIPSFYYRALEFAEQFGEALLQAPPRFERDLCVVDVCGDYLELCLGDPFGRPPKGLTFREFFTRYEPESFNELEWRWDMDESGLDQLIPEYYVEDCWTLRDGPIAKGFRLLKSLDLGPELSGPDAVGGIDFVQGPFPGSNYTAAHARDLVSLSLLQQRLNDLGTGIRVVTGYAV